MLSCQNPTIKIPIDPTDLLLGVSQKILPISLCIRLMIRMRPMNRESLIPEISQRNKDMDE